VGERTPGAFVSHEPCPGCGSGDALGVYEQEDGTYDGTCFSCKKYFKLDDDWAPEERNTMQVAYQQETIESVLEFGTYPLPDRGLTGDTVSEFGVRASVNGLGQIDAHYYPVYVKGQLTGYKKRYLPKTFTTVGQCKGADLFGQWRHPAGSQKMCIVVEGEIDCLAGYQMMNSQMDRRSPYPIVSLPNGADVSAVKRCLEWLESFEKVVLMLDNDKPGDDATQLISELLSPGKAHLVRWPENAKDAGDLVMMQGGAQAFMQMVWDAAPHIPSGIVSGADTWEALHDRPRVESLPYPDNWELNPMTYGIRFGELDTWTSGSGSGKTQVMRELQYHILSATDANVGIIALEEPLADTIEGLMSLYLGKRIHLPDVAHTPEEYRSAWDFVAGTNRIHLYDHWGSTDADTLFNKIRYLARGLDCKYIFLDHLSIVVSEFAGDGDERRQIDTIMSKLKNLTQELGIWIGLVVHLRKTSAGASFEQGAVPSTDDLRGSGSIKQLSNGVYAIARDQQHDNDYVRNTSSVHCLKCRFTGRTGRAGWLHFHGESGRMIPVGDPDEYLAMQHNVEEQGHMAAAQANGQA